MEISKHVKENIYCTPGGETNWGNYGSSQTWKKSRTLYRSTARKAGSIAARCLLDFVLSLKQTGSLWISTVRVCLLAGFNQCVCVCVCVVFHMLPPHPTSWLAGRGQKGHCPQLVMIPTLRCLFVSIIKTPQGHQLQLVMSHRGRAHRGHLTCMKIDRLCHVTAVITRQSDKSYSDQASQRGNSNDILLLLPLNINMLQSGLSFMSENTKTTYSNTEQFEH